MRQERTPVISFVGAGSLRFCGGRPVTLLSAPRGEDLITGLGYRVSNAVEKMGNVNYILLEDDGCFPNNSRCPLLVYPIITDFSGKDTAAYLEELFDRNLWPSAWRDGVFGFHHYHSTAHEALGIYAGSAGSAARRRAGDVVVIPAGVSHRKLSSTRDFGMNGPLADLWRG